MEQALAALHPVLSRATPLTLELLRSGVEVTLGLDLAEGLSPVLEAQLYAQYPDCSLTRSAEQPTNPGLRTWTLDLDLHCDLFPIKRHSQFEDSINRVTADPLAVLLSTLAGDRDSSLQPCITLTVRPARPWHRRRAQACMRRLASPFFEAHHRLAHLYCRLALHRGLFPRVLGWLLGRLAREKEHPRSLKTSAPLHHEREEDLQAAADKLARPLFEVTCRLSVTGPANTDANCQSVLHAMAAAFGTFNLPRLAFFHHCRSGRRKRWFLLSAEELATLWHPPTGTVRAPTLTEVESRELAPPIALPTRKDHTDLAVLGLATFRGASQRFGILPDDRRRHVALVGKTGQGKSTLLHHLLLSDIKAGHGVALLDPHGDLCEAVLAAIPRERTNDVILFDAADAGHPLAFNPLYCPRPDLRPLVASGVLSAFKKLYAEFFGPRMEHIFRNALLAVLELPSPTLLDVLRILHDARFRQRIVPQLTDAMVRSFWEQEFSGLPPKLQAEAIAPIQNKLGHFLTSPLLRHLVGQARNRLDLRSVLDSGQVLLVNLSKGRLGDDASALLGSFLVTSVQLAAMSRANLPEDQRRDFFLYVDEFQNFATASFAALLSEARKYRVALIVANQYLAQLDEATAAALWGNVGTLVSFQVGADDAETIALQLGGDLAPSDLLRLPRYHAYARVLIDGQPSRPFSLRTLSPAPVRDAGRMEVIRRVSQRRYTRPVAEVAEEIATELRG